MHLILCLLSNKAFSSCLDDHNVLLPAAVIIFSHWISLIKYRHVLLLLFGEALASDPNPPWSQADFSPNWPTAFYAVHSNGSNCDPAVRPCYSFAFSSQAYNYDSLSFGISSLSNSIDSTPKTSL